MKCWHRWLEHLRLMTSAKITMISANSSVNAGTDQYVDPTCVLLLVWKITFYPQNISTKSTPLHVKSDVCGLSTTDFHLLSPIDHLSCSVVYVFSYHGPHICKSLSHAGIVSHFHSWGIVPSWHSGQRIENLTSVLSVYDLRKIPW